MISRFLKKSSKVDEEREKLKKDLFKFTRCVEHGFPNKPSSIAYDPKLQLLAMGTKNGTIKIYGAPGVEFYGQHTEDVAVNKLYFLPEQGRLVSLCSDNTLHLWEINVKADESILEEVKSFSMENIKMKTMSVCTVSNDGETLFLGTEGGNVHMLNLKDFTLQEHVIYQDVIMQNLPENYKVTPGSVEALALHPSQSNQILIGYDRGLIVLWDTEKCEVVYTYNAEQQLESLSWNYGGEEFMSSHSDGSYSVWTVTSDTAKDKATPYGPFPCKGIGKILWRTTKSEPFIIFSGGMPRASYGDRHTVTVMQGQTHVVFDFTSRIIDFVTLNRSDDAPDDERREHEDTHSLIVLADEELVVIDLDSDNWPVFSMPYLNCVHSSAITCSQHISNVPSQLWDKLVDAGRAQNKGLSFRDWPINGGKNRNEESADHDILLTGHEDGTVRFWESSATSLRFIYKVSTGAMFGLDHSPETGNEEEEWPPFRKVGTFDPYSDDPRLGIQKIVLCPLSETLTIAGTAGQVIVLQMEREERHSELKVINVNVINDRDDFIWKGHEPLDPVTTEKTYPSGFQPSVVVQLSPPAACTSLALQSEWQVMAAGTSHGFTLFDYLQNKEIYTKCTLSRTDVTGTTDTTMSRRKSFKQSLRDSFRRIRKRRSERRKPKVQEETNKETPNVTEDPPVTAAAADSPKAVETSPERQPIERQVEARTNEDFKASLVRCLYFADTFVSQAQNHSPSFWAGTNAGHVFVHVLSVPSSDKRTTDPITCTLTKEIRLHHKAPVVSMCIIDQHGKILPEPLEVQNERAKEADMSGHQQVIICSEEQFKIFSLPQLRPVCKVKITSIDGSHVRKVGFINFRSKADDTYMESDVACLTNQGDLIVFSVPTLKKQLTENCAKREDIKLPSSGISSFIFTKEGQGFYMSSNSEVTRVSLSARVVTVPSCVVELKEGMRPPPPEPAPESQSGAGIEITIDPAPPADEAEDQAAEMVNANESRADTTGDITVDSVEVHTETTEESVSYGAGSVSISGVTDTKEDEPPQASEVTVAE